MCSALSAGSASDSTGTTMATATSSAIIASTRRSLPAAKRRPVIMGGPPSCFHRPALEREHAARAFLDEQDDEHEHDDLAEHGAGIRLEELVQDAERQRADQRAPKIADAAEHHHHETVDDVALS